MFYDIYCKRTERLINKNADGIDLMFFFFLRLSFNAFYAQLLKYVIE